MFFNIFKCLTGIEKLAHITSFRFVRNHEDLEQEYSKIFRYLIILFSFNLIKALKISI